MLSEQPSIMLWLCMKLNFDITFNFNQTHNKLFFFSFYTKIKVWYHPEYSNNHGDDIISGLSIFYLIAYT